MAANAEVLEVSVDAAPSQKAWAESQGGIEFPILADFHPKGAVAKAYGVYNEERGNAFRSAFLIDMDGTILYSEQYQPGTLPEADALLAKLAELKD